MVCGKDFEGTKAAFTCSGACRIEMHRLVKDGKKPDFWLIAKTKGQKIPLFFPKAKKQEKEEPLRSQIKYAEITPKSYDAPKLVEVIDEVPQTPILTKEQKQGEIFKLNMQIRDIQKEECPLREHPKRFKMGQESRIDEIKEKIKSLEQ